jgi:hypothetical protein
VFAVAVPSEHAKSLTTHGLAAVRGLQLDLLATGERSRDDAAFQELMRLFSLANRPGTSLTPVGGPTSQRELDDCKAKMATRFIDAPCSECPRQE